MSPRQFYALQLLSYLPVVVMFFTILYYNIIRQPVPTWVMDFAILAIILYVFGLIMRGLRD